MLLPPDGHLLPLPAARTVKDPYPKGSEKTHPGSHPETNPQIGKEHTEFHWIYAPRWTQLLQRANLSPSTLLTEQVGSQGCSGTSAIKFKLPNSRPSHRQLPKKQQCLPSFTERVQAVKFPCGFWTSPRADSPGTAPGEVLCQAEPKQPGHSWKNSQSWEPRGLGSIYNKDKANEALSKQVKNSQRRIFNSSKYKSRDFPNDKIHPHPRRSLGLAGVRRTPITSFKINFIHWF